jgi:hypothetical protein
VGRDGDNNSAQSHANAALGEEGVQTFNGTTNSFSGGLISYVKSLADLPQGFVIEITKQDCGSVGLIQRVHGFVKQRFDFRPIGSSGVHGCEFDRDLFA